MKVWRFNKNYNIFSIAMLVVYRILLDVSFVYIVEPYFLLKEISYKFNAFHAVISWILFILIVIYVHKTKNHKSISGIVIYINNDKSRALFSDLSIY